MTRHIYRRETFAADVLLAARDLLGWGSSNATEDLGQGDTEEGRALSELHAEAELLISELSHEPDQDEDPVRSVRAAAALLYIAEADEPGKGWAEIAALLDRLLWARGPTTPADEGDERVGGTDADDDLDVGF